MQRGVQDVRDQFDARSSDRVSSDDNGVDWHASSDEGKYLPCVPSDSNFCVVIRVRPPLPRELEGPRPFVNVMRVHPATDSTRHLPKTITISEHLDTTDDGRGGGVFSSSTFTYDGIFDQDVQQDDVYAACANPAVMSVLQGYNASLIAYGQTGTGKTYTMEGFSTSEAHRGIIPRATETIFAQIFASAAGDVDASSRKTYHVRASYLQIYNEVVCDLLKPERRSLTVREDRHGGVFVDGLSEWIVRSPSEVYGLMERGALVRATGTTRMSEMSSRSHALFLITVEVRSRVKNDESPDGWSDRVTLGKLNIVDLAGSEKVRQTGATGRRLEESKFINRSLSALGNVIHALTNRRSRSHVPYRDSKLTRIMEDSLGGNCVTTMIACVSPALEAYAESLSSLKFANRAKRVHNNAVVNEDMDVPALLRRYERELRSLRAELDESRAACRNPDGFSSELLDQLQQSAATALAQKRAIEDELLRRESDILQEQEDKKRLVDQIAGFEASLMSGSWGVPGGDGEGGMSNIDAAAKVDRYKRLLLQQRDIMIALTARLNERDECIVGLQEENEVLRANLGYFEDAMAEHMENCAIDKASPSASLGDVTPKGADKIENAQGPSTSYSEEIDTLKEKLSCQARERSALSVILDSKIKTRLDLIVATIAGSSDAAAPLPPKVMSELKALQWLVNASVNALASPAE